MELCITRTSDVEVWKKTVAYANLNEFILKVNDAVKGKPLSSSPREDKLTQYMEALFDKIEAMLSEFPPSTMNKSQRYGNPVFRDFCAALQEKFTGLLVTSGMSWEMPEGTLEELSTYLVNSFGNAVRIDYGTGHELAFVAFLYVLSEVFRNESAEYNSIYTAIGLRVIERYLQLVRKIQLTYSLEPAGSHGVWGLDDYQFIPFIWGSSQLIDSSTITPSQSIDDRTISEYGSEYLYLQAIAHIKSIKKASHFGEHSPLLYEISSLDSWERMNTGLLKMYREEVLHKFPVIQHFYFGKHLPWKVDSQN